MNKKTIALFSCLMLSPMFLLATPAKAETLETTTSILPNSTDRYDTYLIYRWDSINTYSFTKLVTNYNGFQVPVKFENTGHKRIVNGRPQYEYVGIVRNTKFGVYNKIISDTK